MMKKQKLLTLLAVTMAIVLAAGSASAEVIFYDSFESPVITGERAKVTVAGPDALLPGWERLEGVKNPDRCGLYPETGSGTGDFTTPFGNQAAWIWGGEPNPALLTTTTETGITDVLTAGMIYTLTFNVSSVIGVATQYYEVHLLAGSTVLESAIGTVTVGDMSQTDSIVFAATSSNPNLGETIRIKLTKGEGGDYRDDVLYDNMQLDASLNISTPLDMLPENGDLVDPSPAAVTLSWTSMEPNVPGNPVYVDVWFGTDPNKNEPSTYSKIVTAGEDKVSIDTESLAPGKYYWQVDSYLHGKPQTAGGPIDYSSGDPCMVEGDVFWFTNDGPIVSVDLVASGEITWLDEPVGFVSDANDDGGSALDYVWSVVPADDPNITLTVGAPDASTATVTVAELPQGSEVLNVTVKLTVNDQSNPEAVESNEVTLDVYADACTAAKIGKNLAAENIGDFIGDDCNTTLAELAELVKNWLNVTGLPTWQVIE